MKRPTRRGVLGGTAGLVALVAAAIAARRHGPPPAAAVGAALMSASVPVLAQEAARERDRSLLWWLLAAQQLRICTAIASHDFVYTRFYAEASDTEDYHQSGERVAELLRAARFEEALTTARTVPFDTLIRIPAGTNLVRLLNGGIYALFGPSRRTGFVVFSWLGFWGLFLFYRAFVIAVPAGRRRTYLRLLFLSPSLLFWTSAIGKEAWLVLGLGVSALGGARTVTGSWRSGVPLAVLGAGMSLLGRPRIPGLRAGQPLDELRMHSATGSSAFHPAGLDSPYDVARSAATVLFRPHLLEAPNRQTLAAAVEGALLVALTLARIRWVGSAVIRIPGQPYVAGAIASTAGMVVILSALSNFGMLVRYRVPIWPFYFVLLSVPPEGR